MVRRSKCSGLPCLGCTKKVASKNTPPRPTCTNSNLPLSLLTTSLALLHSAELGRKLLHPELSQAPSDPEHVAPPGPVEGHGDDVFLSLHWEHGGAARTKEIDLGFCFLASGAEEPEMSLKGFMMTTP